jgi:hypothetical protein
MAERVYKPGETVPEAGIYRVTHYRHRMPHEVTIVDLETFPACHKCKQEVSFVLLRMTRKLQEDADFGT